MNLAVFLIAALVAAGVVFRPFRWPEAVWAVGGAVVLVASGLLPLGSACKAVGRGVDIYLFLTGMMLLSETARREGVFDWAASLAVRHTWGSPGRLFFLVYSVGVIVTVFLSNDATAVVLTPAVFAVVRAAGVEPAPYLFACAMVANAASFVLPISNPANLVLYGSHMPPLGRWLASFALPSVLSIVATYVALRWRERDRLRGTLSAVPGAAPLGPSGALVIAGIGVTVLVLLAVSLLDRPLGAPTAVMGALVAATALIRVRQAPWGLLAGVSWLVLPLVAGLFVVVAALETTDVVAQIGRALTAGGRLTAGVAGIALALVSNLTNNLPAGLIASSAIARAHPSVQVVDALLIGVDLGPNLSITGSLATILWLQAVRREGEEVSFWRFLKVGAVVMPPALIVSLAGRLLL